MRTLDRYVLAELLRAILGGLIMFAGLVFCVHELQAFVKLIVRDSLPVGQALEVMVLTLPRAIVWVLPVTFIFGVIMAIGRLSADGELTAMHAGGISFRRVLVTVALVGLLGTAGHYVLSEKVSPAAIAKVQEIGAERGADIWLRRGLEYTKREGDEIVRHIFAASLNPDTRVLKGISITEYRDGEVWQVLIAESATWRGTRLELQQVEIPIDRENGRQRWRAERMSHEVGDPPDVIAGSKRHPESMTIPEMRARIAELRANPKTDYSRDICPVLQALSTRRAEPWCMLGFALVSAPLGIRRVRSATGISVGLSVLIFVPYYFVAFTLQVINKHGGINPEIPAWTGNVLLYIVGLCLILDKSR